MRVVRGLSTVTLPDYPAHVTMGRGLQFGIFALPEGTYWFAAFPARRAARTAQDTVRMLFAGWHQPIEELVAATPPQRLAQPRGGGSQATENDLGTGRGDPGR